LIPRIPLCSFALLAALGAFAVRAADAPLVAAAANLTFVLPEIAAAFEAATGRRVTLSFGSSGNLARQIVAGGPYELFLSADEASIEFVVDKGRSEGAGRVYAVGRLALFVPSAAPVTADPDLAGLAKALRAGGLRRIAIASPELAPYGSAAREALRRKGLWDALQDRLAIGENAGQAAQFALTGAVDAALIPYAIALAPPLQGKGRAVLVAADLYTAIRQRMVLLAQAGDTARTFYTFLQQPAAQAIFERYGFAISD
jgi:molybdate transport system substrate-binding protein